MVHLNEDILEIGTDLLERAHAAEPRFYQAAWAEQQLLNWVIRDDDLKNRLFRFIEVLPALHNDREIASYLKLYLAPNGDPLSIRRVRGGEEDPLRLRALDETAELLQVPGTGGVVGRRAREALPVGVEVERPDPAAVPGQLSYRQAKRRRGSRQLVSAGSQVRN